MLNINIRGNAFCQVSYLQATVDNNSNNGNIYLFIYLFILNINGLKSLTIFCVYTR